MNTLHAPVAPVQTMSSLEIAKLTEKEHRNVMIDIRRILKEANIDEQGFLHIYHDAYNREQPCFNLPRRECDLVVSGYSVKYRLAIIDRWHELEAQAANPFTLPDFTDPAAAAEAWAHEYREKTLAQKQNVELAGQIEADRPKVEFAMAVRNLDGSCLIENFSKTLKIGRNTFFKRLRDDGYLMVNNMPYQRYIDAGYFVVIEQKPYTDRDGKTHPLFTTHITGQGQIALEKKYRKQPHQGLVLIQGGVEA